MLLIRKAKIKEVILIKI